MIPGQQPSRTKVVPAVSQNAERLALSIQECFMWLFTQYGFYSVVCARDLAGSSTRIDSDTFMVRARSRRHLESLQKRFPQLASLEIADTVNTDYRFRVVVPKPVWVEVARELTAEIDYGNFKDRTHSRSGDDDYVDALSKVWGVMERLQRPNC